VRSSIEVRKGIRNRKGICNSLRFFALNGILQGDSKICKLKETTSGKIKKP
jgi:hypothetical protein